MTLNEAIKERFSVLLKERNMTPTQLCTKAGVQSQLLTNLFQNRRHGIRVSTVEKLCDVLGISLADFFCCDTLRNIEKE